MTYRIQVAPAALRQLRKLDVQARRRVQAAIELLADEPRPPGAKKLAGGDGEWRVRTGDYRIVYEVHDEVHDGVLVVLVVAVGPPPGDPPMKCRQGCEAVARASPAASTRR